MTDSCMQLRLRSLLTVLFTCFCCLVSLLGHGAVGWIPELRHEGELVCNGFWDPEFKKPFGGTESGSSLESQIVLNFQCSLWLIATSCTSTAA